MSPTWKRYKGKHGGRFASFGRMIFVAFLLSVGLVGLFNAFHFVSIQNLLGLYDLWSDEAFVLSSQQELQESDRLSNGDIPIKSVEALLDTKPGVDPLSVDSIHETEKNRIDREEKVLRTAPHSDRLPIDSTHESEIETACDFINSQGWLNGPRFGNLQDSLPDDTVQAMLFLFKNHASLLNANLNESLSILLEQSICYPQSSFRNVSHTSGQDVLDENDPVVRLWAVRLIYASIHYHQHRLAFPEAERRWGLVDEIISKRNCLSQSDLTKEYGVGKFDYECPGAKYLLVSLGGNGLGANVRGGMVPALMLGLMTNRVVLFVNNIEATNATQHLRSPWPLASCPRKDYQCFFWPITPCVLTEDDVDNAYQLSYPESRKLAKRAEIPEHAVPYKVWIWNSVSQPIAEFHEKSADALYSYAQTLLSYVDAASVSPEYLDVLNRAVESIRTDEGLRDAYHYAAASHKIQHTAAIYIMRPNPATAQALNQMVSEITPPDLNPEHALGLPVRASDKCLGESECLSFDEHMTVVGEMWQRHLNATSDDTTDITVVFTSEASSIVEEQQAFVAEQRRVSRYPSFHFSFLTNEHDVTPDSGFMKDIDQEQHDADTIMVAALSSLKAQLLPRVSVGNCCSNFHVLLNDFLSEGCGAASTNTFHCIQESEDPLLAVCCGWHHDCKERKKQLRLELFGNASLTNVTDDL